MEFLVVVYGASDAASPYVRGYTTREDALEEAERMSRLPFTEGTIVEARRLYLDDGVTSIMERWVRE
jgi:hypothetical protein